ncbi:putative monocarboxylate permease [Eremomyces bilateralis CBS 781.70]|uniref:Monocarboxylate permease n=1 Tax=Eremomyces bilateralis CBS 781.70 TaxID=1392243 RepID=A0A6G1GFD9_9PEZI|nr:putative monocarboxylate permease [Eremomyces bilateralis CBS 781.70]KAF1816712.1 putative monocarboxylate permease [Eremomyces bilateralis CBS 781.70]
MGSPAASSLSDPEKHHLEKTDIEDTAPQRHVDSREESDEETSVPIEKKPSAGPAAAFDPSAFPDGGLKAWTVVIGAFACLFCSFGWINCIGVFQAHYQKNQLREYSASTISWIPSLEAFMMFAGGPFIGKAYDNYGPRYILLIGTFLHVFGLMMASISSKYYQFLLSQGICSSIGASMVFYPAMSTVATWFFKRRAFAYGITAAGSSIGGVVIPIMVQRLLPLVGFGWTMRIAAFIILFLLVIANLTVRSRLPPHPQPFRVMDFIEPLKEVPFAISVFGFFLFFLGMFLPINYLIVQASQAPINMSLSLAGYLVSILNAASFFGRVIPGYLGDKIGRYNVLIVLTFFTGIIDLGLWLPARANAPIIVFAALYGFSTGAFVSLGPAVIAQITPDVRRIGVRTGTMFAIVSVAALISNPIGGSLLTRWDGKYTGMQVFGGVFQLSAGFVLTAARVILVGWNPSKMC